MRHFTVLGLCALGLLAGPVSATDLISFNDPTASSLQGNGTSESSARAISADGLYVAFQSGASDLVARGTNATNDFLRVANPL